MAGLSRRAAATVGLAALLALIVGCGDEATTLDGQATQQAVGEAVDAKVDAQVTATTCPDEIEREEGGTFACTVSLKGAGKLPVTVTQVDEEGALDVEPDAAVVAQERIASELKAALKAQFKRSFQVRCDGDALAVREPDSTSTCVARDATSRRTVTVTVTDTAGTLAFEVGGAAG